MTLELPNNLAQQAEFCVNFYKGIGVLYTLERALVSLRK